MTGQEATVLEVSTTSLAQSRIVRDAATDPGPGEVVFEVERFALTSNNVSYVRLGRQLGHATSFPAAPGWCRVPVWAAAKVIGGDTTVLKPGTRIVGYLPMATTVTVPVTAGPEDASPDRAHLLPIYRRYREVDAIDEHELAITHIEPLATVLTRDLSRDGISHVLISSAGSSTARALGFALRQLRMTVTGLSGHSSRAGEAGFDVYGYDSIDRLDLTDGTVFLDIAGDDAITRRVLERFGPKLRRVLGLGGSRLSASAVPAVEVSGAPPLERYSAGVRQQEIELEIGASELHEMRAATRTALTTWARNSVAIRHVDGLESARTSWSDVVRGAHSPGEALTVTP